MNRIRTKIAALSLCFLTVASGFAAAEELIQAAILLDTSSSMDGLIDQAKTQLWKIVNELALARRNGVSPRLEVALYEYGNDGLQQETGYIRRVLPLTKDLDKVSEALFALTTNGGYEYCGTVISRAVHDLDWNTDPSVLKLIFIAGNEEFTQGSIDFHVSGKEAITAGIIVNTIFCGNHEEGVRTFWKEGADIADGKYVSIDHNAALAAVTAPQDDEIMRLNRELNGTYVPYGPEGEDGRRLQLAQDDNAAGTSSESMVDRSIAKSKIQYSNERWDLVDAYQSGAVNLSEVPEEALPEDLKGKTPAERKAYLEEKTREREAIRERIRGLETERRTYIEAERQKMSQENTLDTAVITMIREQAVEKEFSFEE
ncbi:MAG TPA: VWA domain-containing protein [Spirochaetia bacterium]|nr:VWA domain-containing protein [Spirochaetia bacterium]